MISLRESLKKIGEPRLFRPIRWIPSEFDSFPQSLRLAVNAMNSPRMENWTSDPIHIDSFYDQDWTQECQGIATDGNFWYIVSNKENKKAVYKFSLDFNLTKVIVWPHNQPQDQHLGHPALWNGSIYVPVEPLDPNETARVWQLNTDLTTSETFDLGYTKERKPIGKMPWCAINPWNSLLYSSTSFDVEHVCAYNPKKSFAFKSKLQIKGVKIDEVQGGFFSDNGHLYLSSSASVDIRGYSALNGKFLGSFPLKYGQGDEIEGLCITSFTNSDGITSYVHVIILDNAGNNDNVFVNHFSVPDASVL